MISPVFAVYDDKACFYGPMFCAKTEAAALRMFADACADPRSELGRHGSDFILYQLGTYDDSSGRLESLSVPKFLARALTYSTASLSEKGEE